MERETGKRNAEEGTAGWLPHAAESRSFALRPGCLQSRGDGEMPAGTKKGELTRAGGGCGQSSVYPLSTGMSPDGIIWYNSGGIGSGLDGTRALQQLCFVSSHGVERTLPAPQLHPAGGFPSNLLYGKGGAARPLSMNCFAPMGTLAQMNTKPRPPAVGVLGTSMAHRSPQIHKPTCAWRRSWEGWKEKNQ